jgi:hypothetical protein
MQLTEQQIHHFRTFGFLIFRQLFSPSEIAQYTSELNRGLDLQLGAAEHDGTKRFFGGLMDSSTPFVAGLMDDPRFADAAEELLGKPVLGITTDGNYYVGDTLWHPDTRSRDYQGIKFTIYCEPLNASNGALRVIPGSHLDPLHSQMSRDPEAAFGVRPDQVPAFVFDSNPGDVLAFNVAVWHAAFGGNRHRRMGTVVFYEDPVTPAATKAIQEQMVGNHAAFAKGGKVMYPDYWRSIPNPRHRQNVERLRALGILESPVTGG